MKREPILADRALATKDDGLLDPRYREACMDSLRVSKKFVLDSQASIYLARMLRDKPRVVADAVDFAIPPFERMWVEMPFRAFYREMTGIESDESADVRIGYLFRGPRVNTIVEARDHGKPVVDLLPIEYQLHRTMDEAEQLKLCKRLGTSRLGLSLWFWGESAETFSQGERRFQEHDPRLEDWDRAGLRALRDAHTTQIAPLRRGFQGDIGRIVNGSGGDLRNIIALLLFLNRTRDIQYQQSVPQGPSTLINRTPRALLPHSVIKLKLDPLPRLYRLSAGQGVKRRLHDVKGHYRHDKLAREGCPHGIEYEGYFGEWWQETGVLQWTCSVCGGSRWWCPEHKRGDPRVGAIAQVYEVTA